MNNDFGAFWCIISRSAALYVQMPVVCLLLSSPIDQISADRRHTTLSPISAMKEVEFDKLPPLIKSPPRRDLQSIISNFFSNSTPSWPKWPKSEKIFFGFVRDTPKRCKTLSAEFVCLCVCLCVCLFVLKSSVH